MKIVFICQVVDELDQVQASTVEWIRSFALNSSIKAVEVVALRVGKYHLPSNVSVHLIGSVHPILKLILFYRYAFSLGLSKDAIFFVYQNGPYPFLLLPFRLFLRKKVFQWLAHPRNSFYTTINTLFGTTLVFTSTSDAHPFKLNKIRVVGQAVDIDLFRPNLVQKKYDLISVGRISRVKRLDLILSALAVCRDKYGVNYTLAIIGDPILIKDFDYLSKLKGMVLNLNLSSQVVFLGALPHSSLPDFLSRSRAFVFCCTGALGRVVVESMACGVPVITTNICVKEILPEELLIELYSEAASPLELAFKIYSFLSASHLRQRKLSLAALEVARSDHSYNVFFDKIITDIKKIND